MRRRQRAKISDGGQEDPDRRKNGAEESASRTGSKNKGDPPTGRIHRRSRQDLGRTTKETQTNVRDQRRRIHRGTRDQKI